MARYAKQSRANFKRYLAAIVAIAISGFGLVAAQASGTYDVEKGTLSFVSAKEKRGSDPLGSLLTQNISGDDGGDDIGVAIAPGDYVDYYGIASVGVTDLDARVTVVSENGSYDGDSADGVVSKLDDESSSNTSKNTRILTDADWNNTNGGQDWYVEYRIDFFEDLAGTPSPATLENIYLSIYDIDNLQFVEISGFDRYYLSASGSILTPDTSSGLLRLQSSATSTSSSDGSAYTVGRASFEFDSVSSITFRLGEDASSSPGGASFELDFGVGEDWTGGAKGSAVTNTLAANKTVSFLANGGTGSMASQGAATTTALNTNTFTRSGFTFDGWHTTPSGTGGTDYANGANYNFATDLLLYAQWTAIPPAVSSVPYMGPIGLNLAGQNTCVGDLATVSGSRLGSIDKIYIDNTSVPFTLVSDERITFTVPDMKAGSYQVKFWVPVNSVNLTDSITIGACGQAPVESETPEPDTGSQPDETEVEAPEAAKPFYVAKRFTNYRGDRGPVVAADRVAITNFINANPGLTNVTCVGSTSGVPVIETDEALAMARAKNACSIVESLVPGVETRLVTNTGRGVGQFYRAVTLFGKGTTAN